MDNMQKLFEEILNFEQSQISVETQNNFYSKIKELIESNFQEDDARKKAYLEDLEYYHGVRHEFYIDGGSSKPVRYHARNIYDFAQLISKIRFNIELDNFIEKYSNNNRIERDLLSLISFFLSTRKYSSLLNYISIKN